MSSKKQLRSRIAELEQEVADLRRAALMPYVPWVPNTVGANTARCTCPTNRGDNYFGTCPIHDVQITYTVPL